MAADIAEKRKTQKKLNSTYLVKTKHKSVAESIVSCCDKADCDFCIAR